MIQLLKKYFIIFLHHAAPLGLFVFLPLLVILYLGYEIIEFECNKHISEVSSNLENSLKDIESEIAPESFLLKVGRGAWYTYKKNVNNQVLYWDYYEKLKSFLKNSPDLYVFDDNGNLVTPQKYTLKSRFIATKLWGSIFSDYKERSSLAIKLKKQLRSFLGNEFKLGTFLESRNILMPIIVNTKNGYLYWMNSDENHKKGILLIFWDIPSYDFRLNQIVNRYSSRFDEVFIKDYSSNNKIIKSNNRFRNEIYNTVFNKTALIDTAEGYIDKAGNFWKAIHLNKFWLLVGKKCKKYAFDAYSSYFIYFIFLLNIIIFFLYVFFITKEDLYLSIRIKLIVLFLVAVITPVVGFSYLGYQYIGDMKDNLITEFGNECRDILLDIDSELGGSGNIFREDFRKLVNDFQHYNEDENIRKEFTDSLEKHDLALIDRRLASDASSVGQITNYVVFDGLNDVSEAFAKGCIDKNLKTNLMDTLDSGLRKAMTSPETKMSNFLLRPDSVQDLMFGSLEFYLYWCLDKTKNGTEFFLIFRMTDKVLRDYLYKRLNLCKTNPKENKYIILAHNDKNDEWFPDSSLANNLKVITRRLNSMEKPIETQIMIKSKPYLLLAIKSFKIRGYSFYALYPYEKIDEKLKSVGLIINTSIVIFIVIALAIGYQLAGTFIYPVKRLEEGINAIKERNSEFRIETLQNDEFGEVGKSFNKMISELKEMELAKYIQESLLPKSLPKLNGYQLSFKNKMASAVGGDYFDIKLLDEDNLCIIIGDVSGHGVASALIMAIAKAVLYHGFKQTRDLITLFNYLNSVINTYFNKPPVKKMITLFATIINLSTGKTVFFDAGHNFPMKISNDGNITELKMTGFPVGSQKKIRKKNMEEFVLEEGETIVFYTDGIIEAMGKTTEQYGYDRFKSSLLELRNENSEKIVKVLFDNYEKWEDGTEPDDDVTLIVLKKIALKNDKCNIIT